MSNAQISSVSASKAARHLHYLVCQVGVLSHLRLWGARRAASAVSRSYRVRGGPMRSAVDIMRHSVAIGAMTVAVALVGGAPPAYGAPGPGCDGGCNIAPGGIEGGLPNGQPPNVGPSNKGSRGVQPTLPKVKLPEPPEMKISNRPVIQIAPPPPPVRIPPPPEIEVPQPISPRVPVEPPLPDVVPVNVEPVPVPVAPVAIAPVPVEIPPLLAPPSAPPAPVSTPVSLVLFTSSAEPGTQAVTIIVLFMACGCWVYGNRIGSQITVRKRERAAAGA